MPDGTLAAPRTLEILGGVTIGPDAVTKALSLLGQREAGKTNGLAVIAEELHPLGAPVVAIDAVGNLWGLRSSADGKSAGLPFAIFGGERGDVTITPSAGAALAREIVAAGASAIVDVSDFDDDDAREFVADFLSELYRYNRRPLHLLLDEAHEWAPEQPQSKAHFRCRAAVRKIRKLGRNRGIGSTLATQSSADVDKKALGQTDVLIALRTSAPTDVNPIMAWVKGRLSAAELGEMRKTLGTLILGEAWVISPGWLGVTKRARFRLRYTYDSSRTPTLGDEVREPAVFAEVDLERIERAIEADKAGDVKPVVVSRAAAPLVERVEVPVIAPADLALLRAAVDEYRAAAGDVTAAAERLAGLSSAVASAVTTAASILSRVAGGQDGPAALAAPALAPQGALPALPSARSARARSPVDGRAEIQRQPAVPPAAAPPRSRGSAAAGGTGLKTGMTRMLVALRRVGRPLRRRELGTLANVQMGGTMSEYVTTIVARGYAAEADGLVRLTAEGEQLVDDSAGATKTSLAPPTTAEILAQHRPRLKAGVSRIIDLLVDVYPKELKRSVLSAQANVKLGGTMSEYVSTLRRRGLIDETAAGARAADILFVGERARPRRRGP